MACLAAGSGDVHHAFGCQCLCNVLVHGPVPLRLNTNLTGAFLCAKAVHPHLQCAEGGKIINIGFMMSIFGEGFSTPYAATKGGIVQLTRSLAIARALDHIQVNAVLLGWIDTDLTQAPRREIPGFDERITARTPTGRWGVIDDPVILSSCLKGKALENLPKFHFRARAK